MQVRTYVNGTLYSILVKESLKARAEEIGLPDSLKLLIEHSDETFARQIHYILEQIAKEALPEAEEPQSEEEGGEDDEDEGGEDEGAEAEEEEVDVFPESSLALDPSGGIGGEELLCSRYMQSDVKEAQHEAAQLQASMRMDDDRRAGAAARPANLADRKRHHPDEPLQRPSTPRASTELASTDYGAHAMQQSGAQPEPPAEPEDAGDGEPAAEPGSFAYPDPNEIDSSSPTIPVRNRLSRTPSRKTREINAPALQPTAPRPRANVERVQRRAPAVGIAASVKPGTRPTESSDDAG